MHLRNVLLLSLLLLSATSSVVNAELILTAQNVTGWHGQSGAFEVTLTNTGASDVQLSAYQIQITTDVAWLEFTGVSRSSSGEGYVFPGTTADLSSDFGSGPVDLFTAIDLSESLSGFDTLQAGKTYGVLSVAYTIDPLAPPSGGTAVLRFVSPGSSGTDLTQLAGPDGLLAFRAVDGTLTLMAIPEPSGLTLAITGLVLVAGKRSLTRRRA
jgi:hypothetical protein